MKIEVVNLVKHYGATKAVDNISFSLDYGKVYGFVGPNGAGKTTTMRIMASLEEPGSGDVLFNGVSVKHTPEKIRGLVGYMPDNLPTHRDMTVHDYLDFFARVHGLRGEMRKSAIRDIEGFTNLNGINQKEIHSLSKGMKQRVSLARALIHNPQVLIMDEPAAGLDPKARIELRELIRVLAEQGKAVFISSHILGELSEMCDGAVIIEHGKLLQAGHLDDILNKDHATRTLWIRPLDNLEGLYKTLLESPVAESVGMSGTEIRVEVPASDAICSDLLKYIVDKGHAIVEFRRKNADLENVFMKVTTGKVQ